MATIPQALTQLDNKRDELVTNLNTMGVSASGSETLATLVPKVLDIEAGEVIMPKDVNFYDYDGTLTYAWTLQEAQTATALPNGPTHDKLIFQDWNWTLDDVNTLTMPADIGALYTTKSGKTELDITLTTVTTTSVTIRIQNSSGSLNVDWGDGQTSTSSTAGVNTLTHNYAQVGMYTISISGGVYYLYASTNVNTFGNASSAICTAVRLGVGGSIYSYTFYSCVSLRSISLRSDSGQISAYAFYGCRSLVAIVFPNQIVYNGNYLFQNNSAMSNIIMPFFSPNITSSMCMGCTVLKRVVIPANVTTIATTAFSGCYGIVEYVMMSDTPPTLGSTSVFNYISDICKIKVPPGSLEAYQTATNWITYANYMVEWEANT